jgi:hypothetical protein
LALVASNFAQSTTGIENEIEALILGGSLTGHRIDLAHGQLVKQSIDKIEEARSRISQAEQEAVWHSYSQLVHNNTRKQHDVDAS